MPLQIDLLPDGSTQTDDFVLGLDKVKYADLLADAGIPEAECDQYLRDLFGIIFAILDSYYQELREGKLSDTPDFPSKPDGIKNELLSPSPMIK